MDNVTLTAHAGFRTLEASMTLLRRAIDIVGGIVAGTSLSPSRGLR
jgi:D-3-phosphoglycerate dehydrogenase / 2-oxoglutarate reductase